ncbi:hypothetical protein DPMN_005309 [Dreissena polymorpha]|uniref:Uncharacterized protein n=1 Tax=Dreissena polymorpha TaxID=45954 RepID=A0A9D4RWG1_DREPO|nr:hypothetical protein DPMN_005309 [Dreissena polymorpha]
MEAYGMEVSKKKLKIMANSTTNTCAEITMKCQKLEQMTSSKYLGAIMSKVGTRTALVKIRMSWQPQRWPVRGGCEQAALSASQPSTGSTSPT